MYSATPSIETTEEPEEKPEKQQYIQEELEKQESEFDLGGIEEELQPNSHKQHLKKFIEEVNDDHLAAEQSLVVSKEKSNSKIQIEQPKKRSFNSVKLEKKKSGDFSKEAQLDVKPERTIMNKIAQLESMMFMMQNKINQLEEDKKESHYQL